MRLYAHRYPDQIAGMILVDAAHEAQDSRFQVKSLQQPLQGSHDDGMRHAPVEDVEFHWIPGAVCRQNRKFMAGLDTDPLQTPLPSARLCAILIARKCSYCWRNRRKSLRHSIVFWIPPTLCVGHLRGNDEIRQQTSCPLGTTEHENVL